MAKCVQVVGQGIPVRLSDEDAFQIVERDHDGAYCAKNMWRNWYDKPKEYGGTIQPGLMAELVGNKITPTSSLARQLQHARRSHA